MMNETNSQPAASLSPPLSLGAGDAALGLVSAIEAQLAELRKLASEHNRRSAEQLVLEAELAKASEELAARERQSQARDGELVALRQQLAQRDEQLQQAAHELVAHDDASHAQAATRAAQQQELEAKADGLRKQAESAQSAHDFLRAELAEARQRLEQLNYEVVELRDRQREAQEQLETLRVKLAGATAEIHRANAAATEAENAGTSLATEIQEAGEAAARRADSASRAATAALSQQLAAVQQELESVRSQAAATDAAQRDLTDALAAANTSAEASTKAFDDLQHTAEAMLAEVMAETETARSARARAESDLAGATGRLKDLTSELDSQRQLADSLRQRTEEAANLRQVLEQQAQTQARESQDRIAELMIMHADQAARVTILSAELQEREANGAAVDELNEARKSMVCLTLQLEAIQFELKQSIETADAAHNADEQRLAELQTTLDDALAARSRAETLHSDAVANFDTMSLEAATLAAQERSSLADTLREEFKTRLAESVTLAERQANESAELRAQSLAEDLAKDLAKNLAKDLANDLAEGIAQDRAQTIALDLAQNLATDLADQIAEKTIKTALAAAAQRAEQELSVKLDLQAEMLRLTHEAGLAKLASELAAANSRVIEAQSERDSAATQLTELTSNSQGAVIASEAALATLAATNAELTERDSRIANLDRQLESAGGELERLHDQLSKAEEAALIQKNNELARQANQASQADQAHQAHQASEGAAAAHAAPLMAKIAQLETSLNNSNAELTVTNQLLDQRENALRVLAERLLSAEERSVSMDAELNSLRSTLADAQDKLETWREEHETALSSLRDSIAKATSPVSAALPEDFNEHRRRRLTQVRAAITSQTRKIIAVKTALERKNQQCEEVLTQRKSVAENAAKIFTERKAIDKLVARNKASTIVFFGLASLVVIAALAWQIGGQMVPSTYAVRGSLRADMAGRELLPDEQKAWNDSHNSLVKDPELLNLAAARFGQRAMSSLANAASLKQRLDADLTVITDVPGTLTLELRGEGKERTERELETLILAIAASANGSREARGDGATTSVSEAPKAGTEAIKDPRFMTVMTLGGAGSVAVGFAIFIMYQLLVSGKQRFETDMKLAENGS